MAIANIGDTSFSKLAQIVQTVGVRDQISSDFRDFDFIKRNRVGTPKGRSLRFQMATSFGAAGVQAASADGSGEFPMYQLSQLSEKEAVFKIVEATVGVPQALLARAQMGKEAFYMEPLRRELEAKATFTKRLLASWLYADGTGVLGTVSSATDTTGANGYVTLVLSTSDTARGHAGLFEPGDLVVNYNAAGTADAPTVVGTFYAWRVKATDAITATVVLEAVDSSETVLSLTASSIDATDVLYRVGQATKLDLTGSIADYGSATEVVAGLESLANNDGRTTWGVVATGATAGSRFNVGDVQLDLSHIHAAFSNAKRSVGQSAYKWSNLIMSPETETALITANQTDRRLTSAEDTKRGQKFMAYQHGKDTLEFVTSEYVSGKRIWGIPEAANGQGKVIESYMSDFEVVSLNGSDGFRLLPGSVTHKKIWTQYMQSHYTMLCRHPKAVVSLHNFNVA